ncbi:MAG: substrate-binding domain-containing protein [Rhodopseudomonas sp.]|uniref:PstS family phosphate ABC transporter substrate-binding protein n=1 Tax=Rhodopseudomonas sp. TaxID=1078 RepID=UPI0017F51FD7|nr:substrate-binding domain-containing protein [Rhodopseudomonas sp.]NVN87091.1 substrate-binding domain-containing protein [Rhodopseudomonas sp.]
MSVSGLRRRLACPSLSAARLCGFAAGVVFALGIAPTDSHCETLRTGGTGAAVGMLQQLSAAFSAHDLDTKLEVIPGLGSSGAIAAVADGALDFAVAGRPLKPDEAVKSLTSVVLARTPFGLASSYPAPGNIASRDIAAFFLNPTAAWPDSTRVRIILRTRDDSDTSTLGAAFAGMLAAVEQLRQRAEIPIAVTDQDNVRIARQVEGALTAVSLTQVVTESPYLHFLAIDGVEPTLENFERGTYPYGKDLFIVFPARNKPAIERLVAFIRSPEGEKLLRETGNLAAQP